MPIEPTHCSTCKRPLTANRYVSQGRIGVYVDCAYCFLGAERPPEPELLTDAFARFSLPRNHADADALDGILDKLIGVRYD